MFTNELKCLEALMRHLILQTPLSKEVSSVFAEKQTFKSSRLHLFNIISIENFLNNYVENPSFSLEAFLYTGCVPNLYDEKIATPDVDSKYYEDYPAFYRHLYQALRNGNYTFDAENNIFVSSEEIETVIPPEWLYRLSNAFKKSTYKEIFLYNKKAENNIYDKNSLLDYIRYTKTFIVTLSSPNPNFNYVKTYNEIVNKTIASFKDKREVKVNDLIETFKSFVPHDCEVTISKYKLADSLWLVSQAEQLGPDFYNEPLEIQKKYLNNWIIEYLNSNEVALKQTQKYLLLSDLDKQQPYLKSQIDSKDILIGLFNLYINIINSYGYDFNSLSLSDFRLQTYMSKDMQENLIKLKDLIKIVNTKKEDTLIIKERINSILDDLVRSHHDLNSDDYQQYQEAFSAALNEFNEQEAIELEYLTSRNQLQALINEDQKTAIAELAFDNEKIMSLINEATTKGRTYLSPSNKTLYIELYNDELGKCVFKVAISFSKLIDLVADINSHLESFGISPNLKLNY